MQSFTPVTRGVPDVSVLFPFGDDEDWIGSAVLRLADHLGQLDLTFEVLAIDESSGDNSHAILTLLGSKVPSLKVVTGAEPGQGFAIGASKARGNILWLIEPVNAARSLSAFGRAYGRVCRAELDVAVVRGRFAVVKRALCAGLVGSLRGQGAAFERRLARRAHRRGHAVEAYAIGQPSDQQLGFAERLRGRLRLVLSPGTH